jgi:uncharacterized membrane protein
LDFSSDFALKKEVESWTRFNPQTLDKSREREKKMNQEPGSHRLLYFIIMGIALLSVVGVLGSLLAFLGPLIAIVVVSAIIIIPIVMLQDRFKWSDKFTHRLILKVFCGLLLIALLVFAIVVPNKDYIREALEERDDQRLIKLLEKEIQDTTLSE